MFMLKTSINDATAFNENLSKFSRYGASINWISVCKGYLTNSFHNSWKQLSSQKSIKK